MARAAVERSQAEKKCGVPRPGLRLRGCDTKITSLAQSDASHAPGAPVVVGSALLAHHPPA